MTKKLLEITNKIIIKTIMDHSEDTIYFKDIDSKVIVSSKAHALLWGEEDNEKVIGKSDFDYFPYEFASRALSDEKQIMETGTPMIGMCEKLIRKDGSTMWLSASKYPLYDEENNIIGTWGTSRDITSLKLAEEELMKVNEKLEEANAKLQILSCKDSLSGLFNQRYFYLELNKMFELNKRRKEKTDVKGFALILFDIDDFKYVNDTYGHLMGDFAIRHISNIIEESVRINDTCFRYGGDEFAIILQDISLRDAKKVAEKLRKKIEQTSVCFMDKEIKTTVSIGVSSFSEVSLANEMIKLADERLYISKDRGKNRVC